jgi:type I restriction-modification system DNA methylase subunit
MFVNRSSGIFAANGVSLRLNGVASVTTANLVATNGVIHVVDAVIGLGKNLFYNSSMESCLLVCRMKKPKERKGKIQQVAQTRAAEQVPEIHQGPQISQISQITQITQIKQVAAASRLDSSRIDARRMDC